jgi:hypothetical protein
MPGKLPKDLPYIFKDHDDTVTIAPVGGSVHMVGDVAVEKTGRVTVRGQSASRDQRIAAHKRLLSAAVWWAERAQGCEHEARRIQAQEGRIPAVSDHLHGAKTCRYNAGYLKALASLVRAQKD